MPQRPWPSWGIGWIPAVIALILGILQLLGTMPEPQITYVDVVLLALAVLL